MLLNHRAEANRVERRAAGDDDDKDDGDHDDDYGGGLRIFSAGSTRQLQAVFRLGMTPRAECE